MNCDLGEWKGRAKEKEIKRKGGKDAFGLAPTKYAKHAIARPMTGLIHEIMTY